MNTEQNYLEFLLLLTNDQELSTKLASELIVSDSSPEEFFRLHEAAYFSERNVQNSENAEQTLLYMIDVLTENGFIHELDWKVDSEELNFAIQEMSHGKIIDLLDEDSEEEADNMYDLLDVAEELLQERGFGILQMDIDSDSHPIALVKTENLEKLDKLFADLFYDI